MRDPKVQLAVTSFQDRRTPELMRHSDAIQEKRWRFKVEANTKARAGQVWLRKYLQRMKQS